MGKKKQHMDVVDVAHLQPDEVNSLKSVVKEFMKKIDAVDNEIELLQGDKKEIIEEFSDRLDMKTLNAALKVLKIQRGVAHKDAFDLFIAALEDPS